MRALIGVLVVAFLFTACGRARPEPPVATELPAAEFTATKKPDATPEPSVTPKPATPKGPVATGKPVEEPGNLILWTTEDETENAFQYVQSLARAYAAGRPDVRAEVVHKPAETLLADLQNAALTGAAPDLLWMGNGLAGALRVADLIQPVDGLFDLSRYIESALAGVRFGGHTWGVPISNGNHLILFYNGDLVPEPPGNTDEMIEAAKAVTDPDAGAYGLVFNQTDPIWLAPWLGGFGGQVFAADGVTPTLNTPEMIASLQFLYDLKIVEGVLPPEIDLHAADGLFREGKAGMMINGEWMLDAYKEALGDKLGVAPLPSLVATNRMPSPYTSGKSFFLPAQLKGARLAAAHDFIVFATNFKNQLDMLTTIARLPANVDALEDPSIAADPFLSASARQMAFGTPLPTVPEMRCISASMRPEIHAVLADLKTAEEAAAAMQATAESCRETLE